MQPNPPRDDPVPPPPGGRILLCNCHDLCDGKMQVIKERRTWKRHDKYRTGPREYFEVQYAEYLARHAAGEFQHAPAAARALHGQAGMRAARENEPRRGEAAVAGGSGSRAGHAPHAAQPGLAPGTRSPSPQPMQVDEPAPDPAPPPAPAPDPAPPPAPVLIPVPDEPVDHDDDPPDPPPDEPDVPAQDPIYGYSEDVDVPQLARRREIAEVQQFIRALRNATLDGSGLSSEIIARLREPRNRVASITPHERAAIRMYLARGDVSEDNYIDNCAAIVELHKDDKGLIPTYDGVKGLISDVTGIDALVHDMCVNSCVAFTGPFAELDQCPKCREARYDAYDAARGRQVARRTFHTYPLGPQLQAMYASPENARLMRHRANRTREIRAQLEADRNSINLIDDIYWANDYLAATEPGGPIGDNDILLMFSLDGAQLYQSKASDTWFYIWVLFDLPPTSRYKKRYVLPGGVIGGPKKPKNIDSFLFPGLHHLAALQRSGLEIWDAGRQVQFKSKPFLYLATADGPGMAYLSGLVGHQGARGCRLYCGLQGRFKPSASTYYPAMCRADNNPHDDSNHPDYDPTGQPESSAVTSVRYNESLIYVVSSRSLNEYQRRRLETGIAKPSIFAGLSRTLSLPGVFGADLMHLITLNLTDLVISLLRGTIQCDATDDRNTWTWAVLRSPPVWRAHGRLVQDSTRYLPGSFDRPPRNPAEKISSGYKAWEFLLYVYGLLPGLLRGILPAQYYLHFCKLVYGIRIMLQHAIPFEQVALAHLALVGYALEFETLFYGRRLDRLHFIRQSLHALLHLASEVLRLGPGSLYTQWTLENYIGNITREIKQHSTPYANVSERALRRCRINALQAMIPDFAHDEAPPRSSMDFGDGYLLLRARDRGLFQLVEPGEQEALRLFLTANNVPLEPGYKLAIQRWARLRLPNGQIARSAWKERITEARGRDIRRARMVKLTDNRFAEVEYYFAFELPVGGRQAFAMVGCFSPPDQDILAASHGVLMVCTLPAERSRLVIPIQTLTAAVAMVPLPMTPAEAADEARAEYYRSRFFVVEKPGLAVAVMGGFAEPMAGDDDDDEGDE